MTFESILGNYLLQDCNLAIELFIKELKSIKKLQVRGVKRARRPGPRLWCAGDSRWRLARRFFDEIRESSGLRGNVELLCLRGAYVGGAEEEKGREEERQREKERRKVDKNCKLR